MIDMQQTQTVCVQAISPHAPSDPEHDDAALSYLITRRRAVLERSQGILCEFPDVVVET